MHIILKPIGPWPVVAVASLIVLILTIWAYQQRLRGTTGGWRWVALGLRLAAVILCLLAALRPSLMLDEKQKTKSAVIFLIDASESMGLNDEAASQTRWTVARKAVDAAREAVAAQGKDLEIRSYRFGVDLSDDKPGDKAEPKGRETALGSMLLKAFKEAQGVRVATMVLVSDGASNSGLSPQVAAQQLRSSQVPVLTVGVGSSDAGKGSKDLAARDLVAGPTVFVKNRPEIRGSVSVRGFSNQTIEVELYVEGEARPVDTRTIKVPEGADVVPVTGLKYIPETPGEKRLTLKVKKQDGELIATNNEVSTYLDVLKGGLRALYVQGPDFSWDPHYLVKALDAAREIHADFKVIREAARDGRGLLENSEFAPGQYDVYILAGLPADHLTTDQQRLLALAVEKGAGLIMLGGRSSFGAGGWGGTEVARILPTEVGPNDGQVDPGEDGAKVVPNPLGLDSYVLRLGPTPADNARIWASLPPITEYNRLGRPKRGANVLAMAGTEPVMVEMDDVGKGRVIAFGGETWPWARPWAGTSNEGLLAFSKFWRQATLWLARRENKGENQVEVKLDSRRIPVGQKLEIAATARDPKNEPILEVQYETTVQKVGSGSPNPEPVALYAAGEQSKGPYFAKGEPGEYEVVVRGRKAGKEIGTDRAKFMVYQDDRELENPAADLALLKQIATITGGDSLAPEELAKYLKKSGPEPGDYVTQTEKRIWDNWTFFLIFVGLLTAEWALRKAKGWV